MHFLFSSSRTWREWPSHWHSLLYPSHLKLQERTSNRSGHLACIWYDWRASWGCSRLGAENWDPRTLSIGPVYSGPTVGRVANCSFVGSGGSHNWWSVPWWIQWRGKMVPFHQPRAEFRLCFLPPGLLTGPGLQVSQPTLSDSAPSFVIGVLRWIQGLWGMSKKPFENAGSCRMTGYSLCFGNWHKGWGISPSLVAVCGFLCRT